MPQSSAAAAAAAVAALSSMSLDAGATPESGTAEEIIRLLKAGVPLRTLRTGPAGGNPLHLVCRRGQYGVLRIMFGQGVLKLADIDSVDDAGRTPLMLAAASTAPASLDCMRALLAEGANAVAVDKDGQTTLHYAALVPSHVALLLQTRTSGADASSVGTVAWVNACAHVPRLRTALLKAVYHGETDSVKELLKCGANPNIPDEDLQLPMDLCSAEATDMYDATRHAAIQGLLAAAGALHSPPLVSARASPVGAAAAIMDQPMPSALHL